METYCVSCKKNTANKILVLKTKQNALILSSNCAVCGRKNSRFIRNQDTSRLELH